MLTETPLRVNYVTPTQTSSCRFSSEVQHWVAYQKWDAELMFFSGLVRICIIEGNFKICYRTRQKNARGRHLRVRKLPACFLILRRLRMQITRVV